jgi:hypothetical protein
MNISHKYFFPTIGDRVNITFYEAHLKFYSNTSIFEVVIVISMPIVISVIKGRGLGTQLVCSSSFCASSSCPSSETSDGTELPPVDV